MATDLDGLRTLVRTNTLIESDDVTDTELLVYLNNAYNEIAAAYRWPWLETSANITVVAGTQAYAQPADYLRTIAIVDASEKRKLERISSDLALEEWGGDFDQSDPAAYYFMYGTNINLVPIPSANGTNAYIHYYIKQPTLLSTGTDTPEWTDEFHHILADHASAEVWKREEDLQKSDSYRTSFLQGLARMADYYLNREEDKPLVYGDGIKPLRRGTNTPFHGDGSLASW